jgi:hypothetical protein
MRLNIIQIFLLLSIWVVFVNTESCRNEEKLQWQSHIAKGEFDLKMQLREQELRKRLSHIPVPTLADLKFEMAEMIGYTARVCWNSYTARVCWNSYTDALRWMREDFEELKQKLIVTKAAQDEFNLRNQLVIDDIDSSFSDDDNVQLSPIPDYVRKLIL